MGKQTAMQEMLQWVRKTFPMDLDTPIMIEDKIESLLLKEKQQIIDAHFEGWGDAYDYLKDETSEARQAEDYYNETYSK